MGKGKKSRNSRNKPTQPQSSSFAAGLRARADAFREDGISEAFQKMAFMDNLSFQEQKDTIRAALIGMGTDCDKNDADPTGNGDQSMIQSVAKRDAARELYSIGGDIHIHATEGAFSSFAFMCIAGLSSGVSKAIEEVTKRVEQPWSRNQELKTLLETRETSLRLSPLLLIVSMGKNLNSPSPAASPQGVAKILLKHGANPNAQDVLGKSVCHYGAGAMATNMTLEVVDMCIRASKTSHLFGKDIELHSLTTETMNGKRGVVGGFDPDTGRRSLFLEEAGKEVWIKPENMRPIAPNSASVNIMMLTDVQDRLGSVSLHEVCMQNRVDVAKFLLKKHQTSIYTEDLDKISPFKMSSGMGRMASDVSQIIMDVAKRSGEANTKAKKTIERCCANCQKDLGKDGGNKCGRCKVTLYCGKDCQIEHFKDHKRQCSKLGVLAAGVKIDRPTDHCATFSSSSGTAHKQGTYRKPRGVAVDEKFVIKIQCGGDFTPLLIYDETRTCQFAINPGQTGFNEICAETRKEMAWNGRKTFMKASFDESGICTIYPATAGVKAKYTW
jgi:hypothetical protein